MLSDGRHNGCAGDRSRAGRPPIDGSASSDPTRPTSATGADPARRAGGRLAATDPAEPRPRPGAIGALRRPLSNDEEIDERLPKKKALAIFSSDAISSSAYATEEILRVLVIAGAGALLLSIEMAVAIAALLAVVAVSYRQVCRAYPNGGGAYVVARDNLGAALRPDRGSRAAHRLRHDGRRVDRLGDHPDPVDRPGAYDFRIEIAVVSIALITIANLRGLRESGNIFAVPTYLFVGLALAIVGIGAVRIVSGTAVPVPVARRRAARHRAARHPPPAQGVRRRLRRADRRRGDRQRRAGVQAARGEERRQHDDTMAVLLGVLFVGLTVVAVAFGMRPTEEGGPSVVALARGPSSARGRRCSTSSPRARR